MRVVARAVSVIWRGRAVSVVFDSPSQEQGRRRWPPMWEGRNPLIMVALGPGGAAKPLEVFLGPQDPCAAGKAFRLGFGFGWDSNAVSGHGEQCNRARVAGSWRMEGGAAG